MPNTSVLRLPGPTPAQVGRAAALLGTALLLAGCGGGSSHPAAQTGHPVAGDTRAAAGSSGGGSAGDCAGLPLAQASARLCAKVQLSGAVTLSGVVSSDTFSDLSVAPPDNCSTYGATGGSTKYGGQAGFPLPSLGPSNGNGVISGHTLSLDSSGILAFHGPGEYQRQDLSGGRLEMKVDDRTFAANSDSSITVAVKGDGGGSIAFTKLHGLQGLDSSTLDGSVTWTCSNR
ncbi:MAG: hypothetical protein M3066_20265 [Actinomycetota bacterium]|nr:hypothetical protein [Actinomycetota bacterium]